MIAAAAILIPTVLLCAYFYYRQSVRQEQAGRAGPPALHPEIDPDLCGGCGTCVEACPEGDALGLVDGRAALVQPANCVGHGACREVCPLEAITLIGSDPRQST